MKVSISTTALLGAMLALAAVALTPDALAKQGRGERMYRVTVTNATLGQPVAPSVIATHTGAFRLFALGPAPVWGDAGYDLYFGLATAAETGYPVPLHDAVASSRGVWDAQVLATDRDPPVLLPGESNSLTISASGGAKYLSAAAMLGATNDAFYAVRGVHLPQGIGGTVRVYATAYDAGSEANAESADTVGALGATDDDPMTGDGINENGEGFIHVHAGIHGIGGPGGLEPATYDWRNPVVELSVVRIR
ncbi:MAG: spondin domain-containing protein [Chromatiaceae bacterium]